MNNTHTESNTDISHTLGLDASPVDTTRMKRRPVERVNCQRPAAPTREYTVGVYEDST